MCGIAGFIGNVNEKLLRDAISCLANRGPDGEGFYIRDNVGLAHRRLSIIDLSEKSSQPMGYIKNIGACNKFINVEYLDSCPVLLTFNGEIYNYLELKEELKKYNYQFKTSGDSEVLLAAYSCWGIECLHKLNGMFAFAIWDKKIKHLFLARDRLGKKPLYYTLNNDFFAFASEINALKKFYVDDLKIREDALWDYFTYNYIPSPKTFYQNIFSLEPGTFLYVGEDLTLKINRYWKPYSSNKNLSQKNFKAKFWQILKDSVCIRMRADVPLSLFLSDGLDSGTLAYILSKQSISALNIDTGDIQAAENVRLLAKYLNISLQQESLRQQNYKELLTFVLPLFGQPFGDNSSIPTALVCRFAKKKSYKLLMSGDGGDELLFGYKLYRQIRYYNLVKPFSTLFRLAWRLSEIIVPKSTITKVLYLFSLTDSREWYIKLRGGFTKEEKSRIFSKDFCRKFTNYNEYWLFDKYWDESLPLDKRAQVMDIFTYLREDILVKSDRCSSSQSLEVRSPFLDYRLVKLCLQVSAKILRGKKSKARLRELLRDKLPKFITDAPKRGFGYRHNKLYFFKKDCAILRPDAGNYILGKGKAYILNSLFYFLGKSKN